jgi:hypothetical protein
LQDTNFTNELRCAYNAYRSSILDTTHLFAYIDSMGQRVVHAQARHFQKWPILGFSGPAPEVNAIATTYAAELDTLKHWIAVRLQWLDANIPGHCIQVNTGLSEPTGAIGLTYYPNPSDGDIQFTGHLQSESKMTMKIFEMTGTCIDQFVLINNEQHFTYRLRKKGVYYFTISNQEGRMQYGKITIL